METDLRWQVTPFGKFRSMSPIKMHPRRSKGNRVNGRVHPTGVKIHVMVPSQMDKLAYLHVCTPDSRVDTSHYYMSLTR